MATDQRTLIGNFSTDADFRSWGSGLSAQFAAVGLVKTTDTGQIDWTTVLKPSAQNLKMGYEMWRFNDALQATKPVFIRIDFGSGSGSATFPGLWATIGTATNGAGTVTGQVGIVRQIPASSSNVSSTSYCSGGASRLNLATNWASTTAAMALCVERTKTGAGVDTGDGITRYGGANFVGLFHQLVPFVGTVPGEAANPSLDPNVGGTSVLGTDVMLSPTVVFYGKPLFAFWCMYKDTQITALTPITFTHLGATRTYMPLGTFSGSANNTLQGTAGYSLAMLWE